LEAFHVIWGFSEAEELYEDVWEFSWGMEKWSHLAGVSVAMVPSYQEYTV